MRLPVGAVGVFVALSLLAADARADGDFDLDLDRFVVRVLREGELSSAGGQCPRWSCAELDNEAFYSLASELGVVLSPAILSPSETLGFGGFAIQPHVDFTSVSAKRGYWKAAKSYEFEDNDPSKAETVESKAPPGYATTIGMTVRKGLWLPVPSFEVGLGFVHLLDSSIFAPQLDAKLALHEGFHNWPLPEIAVRGSASRAMGGTAFDLTTAGLDFSASKQLGIQGTVNLTPFAGFQILWIIADSQVLDATPGCDPVTGSETNPEQCPPPQREGAICTSEDCNSNAVFFDPDPIMRNRIFGGFRLNFDPASFTVAAAYTFEGSSSETFFDPVGRDPESGGDPDLRDGGDTAPRIKVTDRAAAQKTFSASIGLDF